LRRHLERAFHSILPSVNRPIDVEILPVLRQLNAAGFETLSSCSGYCVPVPGSSHDLKDCGKGYVSFLAPFEAVDRLSNFLPFYWGIEYSGDNEWVLRYESKDRSQRAVENSWKSLSRALHLMTQRY